MKSFYDLSFKELSEVCRTAELTEKTANLLFNWHYKKNKIEALAHQDLSAKAKKFIYQNFDFTRPRVKSVQHSEDKTVKFLIEMSDARTVECVLIPFQEKYTICVSSQVGCAMNCDFCYTGKQGFTRHLQTNEIIGQFLAAKTWLSENRPEENRILNVVFMGQGEPLHNFDAVKTACEILISQHGLSLAEHKITVSTSGYLPGLKRWKDEMPSVNIALSLHSPFNEKRSKLIPINQKYPLEDLIPIVESIPEGKKRFVTYEYLLLNEFNDSESDARALGELLRNTKAFLNLIPFNPFPNSIYQRPSTEKVEQFKAWLEPYDIPITIRKTKGDEILAACGQLNTKNNFF